MKAITTRYHGPTATKGYRITASDGDGNHITVGTVEHVEAMRALCAKMGWTGRLQAGWQDARTFVWVWVDSTYQVEV